MAGTGRRRAYAARVPPEQRREQLLDAALDLVVTEGHDAATVEAVAARAGVTKPVLYGVFSGRGDLLAALLARETGQALAQLTDVLVVDTDDTDDPGAAVRRMLVGFLGAVRVAPQRWHCIVMPTPGMPAAFHAARERARDDVLARVVELVGLAAAAGALPARLDTELTAHAVVALAETAARLTLTAPATHPPQRFADAADVLLGAVGQTRPSQSSRSTSR